MFYQEYPENDLDCFLTTGESPYAEIENLKQLYKKCMDPKRKEFELSDGRKREVEIFKPFNSDKRYVIGADPAEGVDGDYSVGTVYCVDDREQVAVCRGHYQPKIFSEILTKMAKLYTSKSGRYPLMCVERNNHGHAVLLALKEIEKYPRIYKSELDQKAGWLSNKITRPVMMDAYVDAVESGFITQRHKETLAECLTLVNNKGKVEAETGKHDDCVIASALAVQMISSFKKLDVYKNIGKKIMT